MLKKQTIGIESSEKAINFFNEYRNRLRELSPWVLSPRKSIREDHNNLLLMATKDKPARGYFRFWSVKIDR
jgi:hypothetical protein